jgi:hypothetical protein
MSLFYSAKHDRCYVNSPLEYVLDPFNADEIFEGTIDNISESGMCLVTSQSLTEGQEITIKSLLFLPSQTAVVCWVEPADNGYKVGLKFLK